MKRHSITAIIGHAQTLTIRALNYTSDDNDKFVRYTSRIRRAAIMEIIKLDQDTTPPVNHDLAKRSGGSSDYMESICGSFKL